ncbi:MAG: ectoine/hydroxyectoine ABC transporter substrate-binding protein EhuB [Burkholderiales bacterium]|nr:ectoine/hydroxyectoine ABC transporter substrate-binding protein EhuB [Burkholderiales bacterium]MDE2289351.1 ectoine/hydroxyectoine ABC transporter substrate-binding protein EhuB [Burkholderiales bacterium]MDE2608696.1 ectoine/hydroxyectoine ABC transporter substrate-binding protein EhuB [Burkholderiales bacterium]
MKKARKTTLATLLIALAAGLAQQAGAVTLKEIQQRGYVRIAIANEIPYGYMNLSEQAKGIGPDVAKQVMKQLGVKKIKWVVTGFGSLIPGLKANRFDMVAAEMAILPPRCEKVLFSEPDSSYGEGLLVAKGNPDHLGSYEAFAKSGKKVAIMAGADQLDMLQALGVPSSDIVTISSNADAISTVTTGRASAYAATGLTVNQLAAKSDKVQAAKPFTDPIIHGQPARSWGGFAFAQNSADLRNAVNTQLAQFKKTPAWQQLMKHYGFTAKDAQASFDKTTAQLCTK